MYVKRDIEPILEKAVRNFPAIVLTGPRQTGKSTLLLNKFGKDYKYISFDDPLQRERASDDPTLFLAEAGDRVIFDEIQYAPQLLSYIKMRIDANRSQCGKYILTGSQQFNLIRNMSETLAGRIAPFTLLPFSYSEIEQIHIPDTDLEESENYFVYSSLNGSFPENCVNTDPDVRRWYAGYIQTYLERDIRTLYNPGNLRDFTRFLRLLASNCSQVLNLSNYARDLGISVNTVKNWLSVLEAGQMIYLLEPYYRNPGKRIIKSPKVYWNDIGLVCYLTGIYNREHLLQGPMAGALFENLVVQETIKLLHNTGVTPSLYYLRTSNGLEIDLIIEHEGQLFPFEIKLNKSPRLSMAKHLNSLQEIFPELSFRNGTIISLTKEPVSLSARVKATGLKDYLAFLRNLIAFG